MTLRVDDGKLSLSPPLISTAYSSELFPFHGRSTWKRFHLITKIYAILFGSYFAQKRKGAYDNVKQEKQFQLTIIEFRQLKLYFLLCA